MAGTKIRLGFDGKQCIHPNQLSTVNSIFSPTKEEVAHAERVVHSYEQATAGGQGAVGVDGRMIDLASVRNARVVIEQHRLSQT